MSSATTTTLSFQPWSRPSSNTSHALKDVLARVNLERGHFRDITEASLQEEIAGEGALELSSSEDEDGEEEDTQEDDHHRPTTREDFFKAKAAMVANVDAAKNDVLTALDFVSLLLTKDAPRQAHMTMSPFLKERVPLGCLGTDLWQRMPVDTAREAQDDLLATNVRMQGLQQSADSLLAAAGRLQDNVKKETEYWNQILSITAAGWDVCRLPGQQQQQHRLGVRFGFSESSPQFSNSGLAALNASGSDGTVRLERGVGTKPRALRVTLRKDGEVVGMSRLPNLLDADETTLEARIRYARDSLYDEELYHEMIRESRTLTSLGVGMSGSAIQIQSAEFQVELDLISLDSVEAISSSSEEDTQAQAIVLAARLLLSQAHRERLKKRSQIPAPMSDKQREDSKEPALPILRPIMSFLMHRTALEKLNTYLRTVHSIVEAADISATLRPARFSTPESVNMDSVEKLIGMYMRPCISDAELKITGPAQDAQLLEASLSIRIETTLAYGFGSVFILSLATHSGSSFRFENMNELIAATDSKIAVALAKALLPTMGSEDDGWKCNDQEALLVKDTGVGEKRQHLWVYFDSKALKMLLSSPAKKMEWSVQGGKVETGFWDAWKEVRRLQEDGQPDRPQ